MATEAQETTQNQPKNEASGGAQAQDGQLWVKKGKPRVIAPAQRELMKLRIQEGLISGISPSTIWTELAIDKKTYYRMVDELAGEASKERLHKTDRLLHSYLARAERVFREFDSQYQRAESPSEKARIQGMISGHLHSTANFLQSAGFIPKRNEKVEIEGKVAHLTMDVNEVIRKILEEQGEKNGISGKTVGIDDRKHAIPLPDRTTDE